MATKSIAGRSKRVVVITAALLVTGGGIAFAYWTQGGSGTGTAATGTTDTNLVVNQTSVISNLRPGAAAQTLSGTFGNGNDEPVYVQSVTASIASVVKAVGAPVGTCDATDYTLANATMTVAAQIPAGTSQGSWSGATLAFNNKSATNQDACKGATVNLAYTVSGS